MVLSKRERYCGVAALVVVGILLLDRVALTPLYARMDAMEADRQQVLGELERADVLFARNRTLLPLWREMSAAGLSAGPSAAESRVLRELRNWSKESGLILSSLRPERVTERGELRELVFQAAGTGRMSAVAGFLRRLESSPLPVRVTELQLGTRKEGTDDLSLQLRVSALAQANRSAQPEAAVAAPAPEEEDAP